MSEDFNMDVQEDSDVRNSFIYKIKYLNNCKMDEIVILRL